MIMHRLRRLVAWSRKFVGDNCVQSPYVYAFVNDVLSNSTPFYAYLDLQDALNAMQRSERRIAKLLLRLANYMQAERAILPHGMAHFVPFIQRGSLKTTVILDDTVSLPLCKFEKLHASTALVMLHIYRDVSTLQTWREMREQPEATLTFDLGFAGIVLVNPNYPKQHHIIIKC